jgi:hypothetical protein
MNSKANSMKQHQAKILSPLTLRRKIGGTTYIVTSSFNGKTKEDLATKIKRLILSDTADV